MRMLVTGGCGLVGSMAVRLLLEQGHEPVAYDIAIKAELLDDVKDQVTFVRGDTLDVPDLCAPWRSMTSPTALASTSTSSRRNAFVIGAHNAILSVAKNLAFSYSH
jgi:nucleoside-diphosphate-sugar epimerase